MTKPGINFFSSGEISEKVYFVDGSRHRLDGPAWISYYKSGQIRHEEYYINSSLHRLDGPARIFYFPSGQITNKEYYVNNIFLFDFNKYGKEKIFEYIKDYPQFIKEISLMASHNNWLDEKELLLLSSIITFT